MPLGRKHFRRSRDAPICYGKDCGQVLIVKDRLLKSCIYLSRRRWLFKTLDEIEPLLDSEGNSSARTRPATRPIHPFAEDHSRKQRAKNQQGLSFSDLLADLLLAVQSSFVFRAGIFCVCGHCPGMFATIDKNRSNHCKDNSECQEQRNPAEESHRNRTITNSPRGSCAAAWAQKRNHADGGQNPEKLPEDR